jgi:hypothetical protein
MHKETRQRKPCSGRTRALALCNKTADRHVVLRDVIDVARGTGENALVVALVAGRVYPSKRHGEPAVGTDRVSGIGNFTRTLTTPIG